MEAKKKHLITSHMIWFESFWFPDLGYRMYYDISNKYPLYTVYIWGCFLRVPPIPRGGPPPSFFQVTRGLVLADRRGVTFKSITTSQCHGAGGSAGGCTRGKCFAILMLTCSLPETNSLFAPWKWMVGRVLSYSGGQFSRAMLVWGRVACTCCSVGS